MANKRLLRIGVMACGALALGVVAATFVSCSGDKQRRKLKEPVAQPKAPETTQLANTPSACQPLSSTFLTEVWAPVVAPTCVRCHGQGGVGSGSGFSLAVSSQTQVQDTLTKGQVSDLVQVWQRVGTGGNLTALIERITGVRYHGGGTLYVADAPQLEGLRRFDRAAQSTEDCVTFTKPGNAVPSPSPAPSPGSDGSLPAATLQACRSAYQAYTASSANVVNTYCAGCHGPGQGQLSFGVTTPPSSPTAPENATIFAALASYGLPSKTKLFVDKPTAAVPHGGGALVAPGSTEATALQSLVDSLNSNSSALQACLAAIKANPGLAPSVWGL